MKSAPAERAKLLFFALNMQICDVLVAVAVAVAKAPYYMKSLWRIKKVKIARQCSITGIKIDFIV